MSHPIDPATVDPIDLSPEYRDPRQRETLVMTVADEEEHARRLLVEAADLKTRLSIAGRHEDAALVAWLIRRGKRI